MPSVWTADTERKLFLTIIEVAGVSTSAWGEVAAKMGPGFTNEASNTSPKIKKQTGISATPTKAAPRTPKTPKSHTKNGTPTKSAKRKQNQVDEDDEDEGQEDEETKLPIDLTSDDDGTPCKKLKLKAENDLPRHSFKTEMVDAQGQVDLDAEGLYDE